MSIIDIFSDVSGLTRELSACRGELRRIADAMERLSPLPPLDRPAAPGLKAPLQHSYSETADEYRARQAEETELASLLKYAPDSPDFQRIIQEMRAGLIAAGQTHEEADSTIGQALDEAAGQHYEKASVQTSYPSGVWPDERKGADPGKVNVGGSYTEAYARSQGDIRELGNRTPAD
jgi:hypothetical protein